MMLYDRFYLLICTPVIQRNLDEPGLASCLIDPMGDWRKILVSWDAALSDSNQGNHWLHPLTPGGFDITPFMWGLQCQYPTPSFTFVANTFVLVAVFLVNLGLLFPLPPRFSYSSSGRDPWRISGTDFCRPDALPLTQPTVSKVPNENDLPFILLLIPEDDISFTVARVVNYWDDLCRTCTLVYCSSSLDDLTGNEWTNQDNITIVLCIA